MNMDYVQIHYTVVAFTVCGKMPKVIAICKVCKVQSKGAFCRTEAQLRNRYDVWT